MDTLADLVVKLRADFGDVEKQLDLFSTGIQEAGTKAEDAGKTIESEFSDKLQALFEKGMTLNEAMAELNHVFNETSGAFEETGKAAVQAAEQLSLFDEAAHVPYSDAAGQLNLFATELEPIPEAAEKAHEALTKWTFGANEAGEEGHHGAEGAHHLLIELLEFAGIELTIEALKEFVVESIAVYAEVERLGIALSLMSGSAKEAQESIEELKDTAQELGLSFHSLLGMEQRFELLLNNFDQVNEAIRAAADAAAETGNSIERVGNAMERMAQMGMIGARQLYQLKLTMKDVADSMGVSADEVRERFKSSSLTVEQRMQILIDAMEKKFPGAAVAMADSIQSEMNRAKNSWEFAMEGFGEALRPIVMTLLPLLTGALNLVSTSARVVWQSIQVLFTGMVGSISITMEVLKTFGAVLSAIAHGQFAEIQNIMKDGLSSIADAGKATMRGMQEDVEKGLKAITDLFSEHKKKQEGEKPDKPELDTGEVYAQAKARIDIELAEEKRGNKLKKDAVEEAYKMQEISAAQRRDQLLALNEELRKAEVAALTKELGLHKEHNEKLANIQIEGKIKAANGSAKEQSARINAQYREEQKKEEDKTLEAVAHAEDRERKYAEKVAGMRDTFDEQEEADQKKTKEKELEDNLKHQERLLENERQLAAKKLSLHLITEQEKLAIDRHIDQEEDDLEQASLEAEEKAIDEATEYDVHAASKREAIHARMQALKDKRENRETVRTLEAEQAAWKTLGVTSSEALQKEVEGAKEAMTALAAKGATEQEQLSGKRKQLELEIQLAQQRGESSQKQIIDLANVNAHLEAMKVKSEGLGPIYQGFLKDVDKAFQHLAGGIVDIITHAKSLGAAFKQIGLSIARDVLQTLIGGGLKILSAMLTDFIAKSIGANAILLAAQKAAAVQQVAVDKLVATAKIVAAAAVAGANIAASLAALGPEVAIPAGVKMDELVKATFLPMLAFKQGGDVPYDTIAQVHGGEHVINADISAGLRNMLATQGSFVPSGDNTTIGGDHFDFRGAVFGAGLSQAGVDVMMTAAVKKLRRTGGLPTKTGRL